MVIRTVSLSYEKRFALPVTPPARLRRKEKPAHQLTDAHAVSLLKSGRIKERDLDVLHFVWMLGAMTGEQIRRLLFYRHASPASARNVANRRLRFLYDEYCLDRIFFALRDGPVYLLDVQGARIIQALYQAETRREINWSPRQEAQRFFLLPHRLGIAGFVVNLTVAVRPKGSLDWAGETTLHLPLADGKYLEPDGLGLLRLSGQSPRLFFLEWDRGTETPGFFAAKMQRYRAYRQGQNWRKSLVQTFPPLAKYRALSFPPVIVVTTGGKKRLGNILQGVGRYFEKVKASPDTMPVWGTTGALLKERGMLGEVYFQAGKTSADELAWEKGKSLLVVQERYLETFH